MRGGGSWAHGITEDAVVSGKSHGGILGPRDNCRPLSRAPPVGMTQPGPHRPKAGAGGRRRRVLVGGLPGRGGTGQVPGGKFFTEVGKYWLMEEIPKDVGCPRSPG